MNEICVSAGWTSSGAGGDAFPSKERPLIKWLGLSCLVFHVSGLKSKFLSHVRVKRARSFSGREKQKEWTRADKTPKDGEHYWIIKFIQ